MTAVLELEDLRVSFRHGDRLLPALAGVDLTLRRGVAQGLVGESGCGKTLTALSLLGLLPPAAVVESGRVTMEGRDLLSLPEKELRRYRGRLIGMIFQEPMTSLNPVFTVGDQIAEAIRAHEKTGAAAAAARVRDLLERVGIPDPEARMKSYPHQLSGGQRQRVMIAMALACGPRVLVADEPTTALDVTVQARILELLGSLRREREMALLLVTHDLGIVAQETDRTAVMYLGRIVEEATTPEIFRRPVHPYTRALLRSIPRLGRTEKRLKTIPGNVPSLAERPPGCAFSPRCPAARDICFRRDPTLEEVGTDHRAACWAASPEAEK
ncbi:MAG TPA: ABC transporter ATP-binding protein [bacterium]|nr:ABC transporter ATP-binding protein [bacterium]